MTSRIFLGEELCRNDESIKTTKDYIIHVPRGAIKMYTVPAVFRHIFRLFSEDCRQIKRTLARARELLDPVIEKRRLLKAQAQAQGKDIMPFDDAIEWAEAEWGETPYDPAKFQVALAFSAIHSVTDFLSQTLIFLAKNPESIVSLREEIISVLRAEGWSKSALGNMKLLDSALKETLRLKPVAKSKLRFLAKSLMTDVQFLVVMRRIALEDFVLPGGLSIRKGESVCVPITNLSDPQIYSQPENYDMYRFKHMADNPATAYKAHLTSATADHPGFGYGLHACPGRYFAANIVKIALCHLLLKYDWKLATDTRTTPSVLAWFVFVDPTNKLVYRRRKEEIDLESVS